MWLTEVEGEGRMNPRSFLVQRVSDRVFITVKKMTTLRGSPWYTPNLRGMESVDQSSVEMVADKPVYHDCSNLQNSGGAW